MLYAALENAPPMWGTRMHAFLPLHAELRFS